MSDRTPPPIKFQDAEVKRQTLYVISDLHLGGKPGFQMCTGWERLAAMIRWTAGQHRSQSPVHLVIAGDIVDFLAEEPFEAFTASQESAVQKLERAMNATASVWSALRAFVETGAQLTLLLGNHDVELSLPIPRRLFLEYLGPGRVDFVYDNQALTLGELLIEHGNRYDNWNAVQHDALRLARSALSRGEEARSFPAPHGSVLVQQVMNPLKQKYSFIDLLKPETAAVLPLIAVLEPSALNNLSQVVKLQLNSSGIKMANDGQPEEAGYRGAEAPANPSALVADDQWLTATDRQLIAEALALAGITPPRDRTTRGAEPAEAASGSRGFLDKLGTVKDSMLLLWASQQERPAQIKRLYEAWRRLIEHHHQAFDLEHEAEEYLKPAQTLAARGFQVIVFGHTHLARQVKLANGARYINTGTWADLMRLPDSVVRGDWAQAQKELPGFVDDVAKNHIAQWRQMYPTFARIELSPDGRASADLLVWNDHGAPTKALTSG